MQQTEVDEKTKQNLIIEQNFIKVMPKYEQIRKDVLEDLRKYLNVQADNMFEHYYLDRKFFSVSPPVVELQDYEGFELQIKKERQKRKIQKQRLFFQKAQKTQKQFHLFFKKKHKFDKKCCKIVKQCLETKKKQI